MLKATECHKKQSNFTINLHSTGRGSISSIAGVNPRILDLALHDLKKSFAPHSINPQVLVWLYLNPVLKGKGENKSLINLNVKI